MKKHLFLLLPLIMLSCSDDDDTGSVYIDHSNTLYNRISENNNGKYDNRYHAEVTNKPGHAKSFFASLETEKIIDESYLIGAEFVRGESSN